MSDLEDLIEAGAGELILPFIREAKADGQDVIAETGEKVEKWLILHAIGELDSDELHALLNARRRTVEQFAASQAVEGGLRITRMTVALIDIVLIKILL